MFDHYDRAGIPLTPERFAELRADESYLIVARTRIAEMSDLRSFYEVSTVWLGVDMGHGRTALPILFETLVFNGTPVLDEETGELGPDWSEVESDRYATEAEASQGHIALVAQWSANFTNPLVMDVAPTDITRS